MQLSWSDDLNTGIPEIDAQNRRIVDLANILAEAKQTGDRALVGEVLEQLLDYVVNHFLFEEQLMEEANYEYRAAHERVHELFAKRLADFRGRYAQGDDIIDDLRAMLTGWLQSHVREEDQRYAESVNAKSTEEGGQSWIGGVWNRLFG